MTLPVEAKLFLVQGMHLSLFGSIIGNANEFWSEVSKREKEKLAKLRAAEIMKQRYLEKRKEIKKELLTPGTARFEVAQLHQNECIVLPPHLPQHRDRVRSFVGQKNTFKDEFRCDIFKAEFHDRHKEQPMLIYCNTTPRNELVPVFLNWPNLPNPVHQDWVKQWRKSTS